MKPTLASKNYIGLRAAASASAVKVIDKHGNIHYQEPTYWPTRERRSNGKRNTK